MITVEKAKYKQHGYTEIEQKVVLLSKTLHYLKKMSNQTFIVPSHLKIPFFW